MVLTDVTRNVILANARCRSNVTLTPIHAGSAVTLAARNVTLTPGGVHRRERDGAKLSGKSGARSSTRPQGTLRGAATVMSAALMSSASSPGFASRSARAAR